MGDPRLDALYRDLVARYGKAEADRRLRAAHDEATDALDRLIRQKADEAFIQNNVAPKAGPPIKGSTFVRYLAKDVELWQLPRSQEASVP